MRSLREGGVRQDEEMTERMRSREAEVYRKDE
jgi:hypothetical protein